MVPMLVCNNFYFFDSQTQEPSSPSRYGLQDDLESLAGLGVTMLIGPHHPCPPGSESGGRGFNKHLGDSDTSDLQSTP